MPASFAAGGKAKTMGARVSAVIDHAEPAEELCAQHKKKIEIICIDCKERLCSHCALFGEHKPHDIREETEVVQLIKTRAEAV